MTGGMGGDILRQVSELHEPGFETHPTEVKKHDPKLKRGKKHDPKTLRDPLSPEEDGQVREREDVQPPTP